MSRLLVCLDRPMLRPKDAEIPVFCVAQLPFWSRSHSLVGGMLSWYIASMKEAALRQKPCLL